MVDIADTGAFVIDTAHVLDPATRERLQALLKELEQKTTDQIKVLTVETTGGEDIFSFAQRHYDHWKLGLKGKSNGALIVLALRDRKVRIHAGYGLEGSLPDSFDGTLSREIAQQYFRKGQYAEGLYEMTLSVVNKVAADEGVKISGLPQAKIMPRAGPQGFFPACMIFVPFLTLLFLIWVSRQRRLYRTYWGGNVGRGVFWGAILNDMLRSGSSGSWTSSGGSSGGFGGGGGSFGGGGSSGGGGGGASW
ncbi:MAG: TPM domain-containing protein [Planctomycetia bacterium]|nr:TPM domain-containing protein [Planctomycetia bacterium]